MAKMIRPIRVMNEDNRVIIPTDISRWINDKELNRTVKWKSIELKESAVSFPVFHKNEPKWNDCFRLSTWIDRYKDSNSFVGWLWINNNSWLVKNEQFISGKLSIFNPKFWDGYFKYKSDCKQFKSSKDLYDYFYENIQNR